MKRISLTLSSMLLFLTALLPGCRDRIVFTGPGDWMLLGEDPDDGTVTYNGQYLYVDADFSDGDLTFKVETYDAIPDATSDVQFAVFFDVDQSSTTGFSTSSAWEYAPNDIGAEFMMMVGRDPVEGGTQNANTIYAWDLIGNSGWTTEVGSVSSIYQPAGEDSVIGGVSLANLGGITGEIDVVAILVCDLEAARDFDYIPDAGHFTINIDSGTVTQASAPLAETVKHPPAGKRISLISGKELILEEVR
jgi:hypothetical protein